MDAGARLTVLTLETAVQTHATLAVPVKEAAPPAEGAETPTVVREAVVHRQMVDAGALQTALTSGIVARMHACSVALVKEAVLRAGVAETPIAALGTVEGKRLVDAGATRRAPTMGTVAPMLVPCVALARIPAEIPGAAPGVDSSGAEEAMTTVVQATAGVRHLEAATATPPA